MMERKSIAERIMETERPEGGTSTLPVVFWLGGAGFVIKHCDTVLGIDLYLSDACEGNDDYFKRLMPPPVSPEDIELDYLIVSHEHGDHLDRDSIHGFINHKKKTKLIGTSTVKKESLKLGVPENKILTLDRNESVDLDGFRVSAVYCDHGDGCPDAIGVIVGIGGKRIYFTGDTRYRPSLPGMVGSIGQIDLLIVPINGTFENPDAKDAAYIAAWVKPVVATPCHYWLFKEQCGNPAEFVERCAEIAPDTFVKILTVGEAYRIVTDL